MSHKPESWFLNTSLLRDPNGRCRPRGGTTLGRPWLLAARGVDTSFFKVCKGQRWEAAAFWLRTHTLSLARPWVPAGAAVPAVRKTARRYSSFSSLMSFKWRPFSAAHTQTQTSNDKLIFTDVWFQSGWREDEESYGAELMKTKNHSCETIKP